MILLREKLSEDFDFDICVLLSHAVLLLFHQIQGAVLKCCPVVQMLYIKEYGEEHTSKAKCTPEDGFRCHPLVQEVLLTLKVAMRLM